MSNKNQPTGLDRRMFGRTLGEWAKMTPEQRLADDKIGDKRIGPLNEAVAAALGEASVTNGAAPTSTGTDLSSATDGERDSAADNQSLADQASPAAPAPSEPSTAPVQSADVAPAVADPAAPTAAAPSAPPAQDTPSDPSPAVANTVEDDDDNGVTIGTVISELLTEQVVGYVRRSPTPKLTAEQAEKQAKIFAILERKGVNLRDQSQVYAWLLDQV